MRLSIRQREPSFVAGRKCPFGRNGRSGPPHVLMIRIDDCSKLVLELEAVLAYHLSALQFLWKGRGKCHVGARAAYSVAWAVWYAVDLPAILS